MQLTDDQKSQIATRLAAGDGIAEIQKLVNDDFGISMTYMEVRFLIDDLDLDLAPPPQPEPETTEDGADPIEAEAELMEDSMGGAFGGVTVELDRIKRPGAVMSGSVVFSDGEKASWQVDSYGRLGLESDTEGYQPSQDDIQSFQLQLQQAIQGARG